MKEKNKLLIFSSAIQIVFIVLTFINLKGNLQNILDSFSTLYGNFPADAQARVYNMLNNHGLLFLGISYAIPLISNIVLLIIALKNKLENNKRILISLSLVNIILFVNIIALIFAIIQLVISIKIKKSNNEEDQKNKEIPVIEYTKPTKKEIIWAIVLLLVYSSQFGISHLLQYIPEQSGKIAIVVAFYLICLVLSIIAFKDKLKKDLKLFKDNFKAYLSFITPRYIIYYLIYFTIAIICATILKTGVSENQKSIEQLPLYVSIPLAVIWAPIVEELIFRGAIRRFIKNNIAFIIVSGLLFGLLHTFDEGSIEKAILLGIPYITCGLFLAYMYKKTNNITVSMIIHSVNNIIATLISILVTSFIF